MNGTYTQKKTPSEIRTADDVIGETATYLLPHSIYCLHRPRLVPGYVSIRTNRRLGYFDKTTKTAPIARRQREHGCACSRQSRERRAR